METQPPSLKLTRILLPAPQKSSFVTQLIVRSQGSLSVDSPACDTCNAFLCCLLLVSLDTEPLVYGLEQCPSHLSKEMDVWRWTKPGEVGLEVSLSQECLPMRLPLQKVCLNPHFSVADCTIVLRSSPFHSACCVLAVVLGPSCVLTLSSSLELLQCSLPWKAAWGMPIQLRDQLGHTKDFYLSRAQSPDMHTVLPRLHMFCCFCVCPSQMPYKAREEPFFSEGTRTWLVAGMHSYL